MLRTVISRTCQHLTGPSRLRYSTEPMEINKMEKTLNKVTVLGRVGYGPQKRGTEQHPVVIFSVATHTNYKHDTGDYTQRTDWHKVCIFKPYLRDSVFSYMKKGQRVLVNGRITYGEFTDEDGNSRPSTAIVAEEVIFFHT